MCIWWLFGMALGEDFDDCNDNHTYYSIYMEKDWNIPTQSTD